MIKINHSRIHSLLKAVAVVAAIGQSYAYAAVPPGTAWIVAPGYGPGVAGHVTLSPTTPVCRTGVPCERPYNGAIVQVLDLNRQVVASAVTNPQGAFIASVPPGDYTVHIMTIDFPRCPEASLTVGKAFFTLTTIACDTGLR